MQHLHMFDLIEGVTFIFSQWVPSFKALYYTSSSQGSTFFGAEEYTFLCKMKKGSHLKCWPTSGFLQNEGRFTHCQSRGRHGVISGLDIWGGMLLRHHGHRATMKSRLCCVQATWWQWCTMTMLPRDAKIKRIAITQSWSQMKALLRDCFLPFRSEQILFQQFQNYSQGTQSSSACTREFLCLQIRCNLNEIGDQEVAWYANVLNNMI